MATDLTALLGGGGGGGGWKPESKTYLTYTNTLGLKANVTAPSGKLIKITFMGNYDTRGSFHPTIALVVNGVNIKTGTTSAPNTSGLSISGAIMDKGTGGDIYGFSSYYGNAYNEIFCTSFSVTVTTVSSSSTTNNIVYEIGEFI
jgi:hypothetical protein